MADHALRGPRGLALMLALALVVLGAGPALAHKVSVYAYVEGGRIVGEGFYAGGGKPKQQKVEILDKDGKSLASTVCDDQGAFGLALPKGEPPFTVVLHAGGGHQAAYELTAKDLGLEASSAPAAASQEPGVSPPAVGPVAAGPVDAAALEAALDRVLERRLAPLGAQIERMALAGEEIGISEIVGGLGWILGLLGIGAWFMARKERSGGGQGRSKAS